ncbi:MULTISPECIES: TadE family protein [unclassified Streptomyces]|uniref:TadE family protein n=1 Tax=unclassified Streptomyces TaxID=2593676 RepID=UPI00381709AB
MTRRARREDRGQAAVEFVGVVALLIFVALAVIQLGIAGYAVQQAGTAARAAARAESYRESDTSGRAAGRAAVSDWLDVSIAGGGGEAVTMTATIPIPSILPVFQLPSAQRSATMPRD